MKQVVPVRFTASILCFLGAGLAPASAVPIDPTFFSVDVPFGTAGDVAPVTGLEISTTSTAGAQTFTDDVYLNTLSFGATTFSGATNFSAASALRVTLNPGQVNVEWGDDDTDSDGDANPMAKIGRPDSDKETTVEPTQSQGLLQVFNSLSLSEMTDGESGAAHGYSVLFQRGIRDNAVGDDDVPEIVIFERGRNDSFALSLIIGGTLEDPILSDALLMNSANFAAVGMLVDTTEIASGQIMGVAGFDLDAWGLDANTSVFGFAYEGTGADLSGVFATGEEDQFIDPPPSVVPLPAGVVLLLGGLAALVSLKRRRTA